MVNKCMELFVVKRKIAISVVVPLYKGREYIKKVSFMVNSASELFYQETGQLIELIFVNDYPEDILHIDELEKSNVHLINNDRNLGIHASRIIGLRRSKGKYIHFLDQDDLIDKEYYVSQYTRINDNDVVVCNGKFRNSRVIIPDLSHADKITSKEAYFSSLSEIVSPGQTLIRRSSIPKEWTKYVLQNNYCDDAFLWVLMKNNNKQFTVNFEMLYVHVETGENASQNWTVTREALFELMKVIRTNNLIDKKYEQILIPCIENKMDKHSRYETLENDLKIVEKNPLILKEYLIRNNYKNISLYGYGIIGKRFHCICKSIGIKIGYSYDKGVLSTDDMEIYAIDQDAPIADIIIITPVQEKEVLMRELRKRRKEPIIGIDTLLSSVIEKM